MRGYVKLPDAIFRRDAVMAVQKSEDVVYDGKGQPIGKKVRTRICLHERNAGAVWLYTDLPVEDVIAAIERVDHA